MHKYLLGHVITRFFNIRPITSIFHFVDSSSLFYCFIVCNTHPKCLVVYLVAKCAFLNSQCVNFTLLEWC
jgi:hypothetical protein